MRRILLVLSVAALMAAMVVATALPAFAQGRPEGAGPPAFVEPKGPPFGVVPGGRATGVEQQCTHNPERFADLCNQPPPPPPGT